MTLIGSFPLFAEQEFAKDTVGQAIACSWLNYKNFGMVCQGNLSHKMLDGTDDRKGYVRSMQRL